MTPGPARKIIRGNHLVWARATYRLDTLSIPWLLLSRQTRLRLLSGEKSKVDPPENDLVGLSLSDVE